MTAKIGIVVPTLGIRKDYLIECLQSIRSAGDSFVTVVAPEDCISSLEIDNKLLDRLLEDPMQGLAAAINFGIHNLPKECEYVSWLGDDDVLVADTNKKTCEPMELNEKITAVFGICDYIDAAGKVFWQNSFGQMAVKLLIFGPNKIPQPGSLIRRSAFESIGGLDESLGWAFDQDMFARLAKIGTVKFLPERVSKFRWHKDSLSSGSSKSSIEESSAVRLKNANWFVRAILVAVEPLHVLLASSGGRLLDRLSERK